MTQSVASMKMRCFFFLLMIVQVSACVLSRDVPPAQREPIRSTALTDASAACDLGAIQDYIKTGWKLLRRSHHQLLQAAADLNHPNPNPAGKWRVYVSAREDLAAIRAKLAVEVPKADWAEIELLALPTKGPVPTWGLLYLPYPYVVPGGMFNEMYGWDSYFIQNGLIADGEWELAKNLTDNFVYEVIHYGTILNGNRAYYLTRSQPPFLTQMVLAIYRHTGDRAWLRSTLPAIESYYRYWTVTPHWVPETGLSRYHDLGSGPAPEVSFGPKDAQGMSHFDHLRRFYREHPQADYGYDPTLYYDAAQDKLTDLFYVADRSMRESGFDPADRFGRFNAAILDYHPVCLNTFLYEMEKETAEIYRILNHAALAETWRKRSTQRALLINELMWDETAGQYFDYDFKRRERRHYPFATTFLPLWAGIASPEQAARVVANLPLFLRDGGLQTSAHVSGSQWDAPFGWAPLQLMAIKGLERYGYHDQARQIKLRFLALVLKEFREHHAIFEKYDVVARESHVAPQIRFGYTSNERGFGWTNAAFTELLRTLSDVEQKELVRLSRVNQTASGGSNASLKMRDSSADCQVWIRSNSSADRTHQPTRGNSPSTKKAVSSNSKASDEKFLTNVTRDEVAVQDHTSEELGLASPTKAAGAKTATFNPDQRAE